MSTATPTAGSPPGKSEGMLSRAWDAGVEAEQNENVSLTSRVKEEVVISGMDLGVGRAANLAAGAVMLLITLMIVLLAALVGGQFAAAIPSDSPFSDAINTTTNNAGTAFVIFGVSLLAIPTVSVLAYIVMKLGPFIGFNGGGGNLMNRR
jgi:hypothetical protein